VRPLTRKVHSSYHLITCYRASSTRVASTRAEANGSAVRLIGLTEQLAAELTRLIGDGAIQPRMPQATDGEMARQFGVGKSAIGEAILVLSTKDLVEVTQGSGTRVTDPGKWNVIDSELVSLIVRRGRRKTHEHAVARARILDHLERVAYDRQSRSFLA